MATLTRDQLLQVNAAARSYQAIYDEAFKSWGIRAQAPAYCDSVEAVGEFRRNLAVQAKRLLPLTDTRAEPREPTFGDLSARNIEAWLMMLLPPWSRRCSRRWRPLESGTIAFRSTSRCVRYTNAMKTARMLFVSWA